MKSFSFHFFFSFFVDSGDDDGGKRMRWFYYKICLKIQYVFGHSRVNASSLVHTTFWMNEAADHGDRQPHTQSILLLLKHYNLFTYFCPKNHESYFCKFIRPIIFNILFDCLWLAREMGFSPMPQTTVDRTKTTDWIVTLLCFMRVRKIMWCLKCCWRRPMTMAMSAAMVATTMTVASIDLKSVHRQKTILFGFR